MSGFVEKILQTIQDFTAHIINAAVDKLHLRDVYEKNRILFISALSLVLLLVLLTTVFFLLGAKEKKVSKDAPLNLDITQPFVLPKEPSMNNDYYLSRPKNEVWTQEEAEKWFTIPNDAMLNQLEHDNNNLIQNLLETSP